MERVRLMIADDNQDVREGLERFFKTKPDIELVALEADGYSTVQVALLTYPDVLLLDLVMPRMDGFKVIQQLRGQGLTDMRIIVLTSMYLDHTVRQAIDLGADFVIVKPFDFDSLYERVVERAPASMPKPKPEINVRERQISAVMNDTMGIPTHVKGGRYVLCSASIVTRMPEITGRITKEVYPAVARLYDSSPQNVERAMRYVIRRAWDQGGLKACGLFPAGKCPTNTDVILTLAGHVPKRHAEKHQKP